MEYDLLIKNAQVVLSHDVVKADIGISNEKIVRIEENIGDNALEIIDADGLHVLPGVTDAHVHFDEPGRTEWETIATGSAAFAAGGGSLYFDMPLNSFPTTCDVESFQAKLTVALKDSYIDFGIWGGLTPSSLDHVEALAEAGVIGFKSFACFT